jgi:hypothetical protein
MENVEWARIEYQKDYDKYKSGVGIVVRDGWDGYNKRNTYTSVDPMLVIPDPDGDYVANKYKFIGFEMERFEEQIPENYKNVDQVPD